MIERNQIGRRGFIKTVGIASVASAGVSAAETRVPVTTDTSQIITEKTDSDVVEPWYAVANQYQSSTLTYFGSYWDGLKDRWLHDFRLSSVTQSERRNDTHPDPHPPVVKRQYYDVTPDDYKVVVNADTPSEYHGMLPTGQSPTTLEEVAETIVLQSLGTVNQYLSAALTIGEIMSELSATDIQNDGDALHVSKGYMQGIFDETGVPRTSHYQRFRVEKRPKDCSTPARCGFPQTSEATVQTGTRGDDNLDGSNYDSEVTFDITVWPDEDEGEIEPAVRNLSTVDPNEMSPSEKDSLGLYRVSTENSDVPVSRDQNYTYYATNIPVSIESE